MQQFRYLFSCLSILLSTFLKLASGLNLSAEMDEFEKSEYSVVISMRTPALADVGAPLPCRGSLRSFLRPKPPSPPSAPFKTPAPQRCAKSNQGTANSVYSLRLESSLTSLGTRTEMIRRPKS